MRKIFALVMGCFILIGYVATIMYVFFAINHIDTLENYIPAMVFEIVGFVFLFGVILGMIAKPLKIGYAAPLILLTIVYTVVLDVANIYFITQMEQVYFVIMNAIILLVYCGIFTPLFIMGMKQDKED